MTRDTTDPAELSLDALFEILANQQRRYTLCLLSEMDGVSTAVSVLVDVLIDDLEISRDRLRMNLRHRHLPKMANYGLIKYNWQEGTIRYQSNDRLEALLEVSERRSRSNRTTE
ncbi:DUF7344 domain-containing protein [Haladaptatus caseinilyticus]|uniref:DUF7344 domain-containing protein n=1 Tax=Haladaptatus caseinilyticus TaxID=2993314 RepID=UPI00224B33C5|nr:hypothetical protein [Haladaptatus caseinilyticus]